jgi:ATP-dependent DNA helicase RecG
VISIESTTFFDFTLSPTFVKIFISHTSPILSNPIEYLKGVGPLRADLLKKEMGIFTFGQLLDLFPFRHVDKTSIRNIADITPQTEYILLAGTITDIEMTGEKRSKRLTALLKDKTGSLELTWFQGISWIQKALIPGAAYLVYGKPGFFMGKPQITHPELEPYQQDARETRNFLEPVYPSTEKLKARGLTGRSIGKLTFNLFGLLSEKDIPEILPESIIRKEKFPSRWEAYRNIHFPVSAEGYEAALHRLKFEEFFLAQVRLGLIRSSRHRFSRGFIFEKVGSLFNDFYTHYLPFSLTGAQKRVLKEIRKDTGSGRQMNRLLQGDVGSGKTIVALMSMLIAADNGFQSCLMAPTEILAQQHFESLSALLKNMPVSVQLLTGSTKTAKRRKILEDAANGNLHILIGTHALIEQDVQFLKLGLAIVDEQHRFGVAQRARLWEKAKLVPHVLVMTATPIPRTLAMTAYGDLDTSIMDEMPPGRQPILTVHRLEDSRPQVMDFIRKEIRLGRQAYIIFPLIEESEKLNYENLMQGYENVKAWFPEPKYWISMVHGRMKAAQKEENMHRFVSGETQIMVSTTVIEVGVNVPNASVMVIESAEKFGLSQLHQLRGRVGRGAEKSYCILLTGNKVSREAKERLGILCATNDGFRIAEKDLEIRGPGDIEGTRQSGALNFKLANILTDRLLLEKAKVATDALLDEDPDLELPGQALLKKYLQAGQGKNPWSKIS